MERFKELAGRWLEIGTEKYSSHTRRRLMVLNALMTSIPVLGLFYATALSAIDFNGFLYPILFIIVVSPFFLLTPFCWRYSIAIGTYYNLALWIGFELTLCYLFGRDSGIHFLFLAGSTASILMFGVRTNVNSIVSMSVGIIGFIFAQRVFKEPSHFVDVSEADMNLVLLLSVVIFITVVFWLIHYAFVIAHKAERLLEEAYEFSDGLLKAMMPASIAEELKQDRKKTIADGYDNATILFADLAGFTDRSSMQSPREVINFLNQLFTRFDELATKHGVEKIKTLGDSYMAAAGLPELQEDHVERVANFAIDLLKAAEDVSKEMDDDFHLRVGFHTGPAVAGVIGTEKPFYDVWGDTVNTASRLESQGKTDSIQVTKVTKELLQDKFTFRKRGMVDMKGKGTQEVWYLLGRKTEK